MTALFDLFILCFYWARAVDGTTQLVQQCCARLSNAISWDCKLAQHHLGCCFACCDKNGNSKDLCHVCNQYQSVNRTWDLVICVPHNAGNLVMQQTAASLLAAVKQADPRQLADITAGLTELQLLGYSISSKQLQQIHQRKTQLLTAT